MTATVEVSAQFTRPADTTQYAVGDLVANSATAGSVVALKFNPVVNFAGQAVRVEAARIFKSGTGVTSSSFRLHLFEISPGTPANGDNGAFSCAGKDYAGAIDITVDRAFTDGAFGRGLPLTNTPMTFLPGAGEKAVYGLLEARGTYTPGNAEVFTVTLEGYAVE
jgi:hypothetical protein